jgi:hypothetical protein
MIAREPVRTLDVAEHHAVETEDVYMSMLRPSHVDDVAGSSQKPCELLGPTTVDPDVPDAGKEIRILLGSFHTHPLGFALDVPTLDHGVPDDAGRVPEPESVAVAPTEPPEGDPECRMLFAV